MAILVTGKRSTEVARKTDELCLLIRHIGDTRAPSSKEFPRSSETSAAPNRTMGLVELVHEVYEFSLREYLQPFINETVKAGTRLPNHVFGRWLMNP